jgi:hypothetical protein
LATSTTTVIHTTTGLGKTLEFVETADTTTAPTAATYNYRTQATADAEEALDLGDVATEHLLVLKAVTNDLDVDLDFVSAFDADFTIPAGECAVVPKPAGVVYVKNNGAGETCVYEYVLTGTT